MVECDFPRGVDELEPEFLRRDLDREREAHNRSFSFRISHFFSGVRLVRAELGMFVWEQSDIET